MDDGGGAREEEKRCAQLLGKLPSEVERDAAEVGVAEEFIEIVGEELKDETEVVLEHEVAAKWRLPCRRPSTVRRRGGEES